MLVTDPLPQVWQHGPMAQYGLDPALRHQPMPGVPAMAAALRCPIISTIINAIIIVIIVILMATSRSNMFGMGEQAEQSRYHMGQSGTTRLSGAKV